jgi:hypothetical protein
MLIRSALCVTAQLLTGETQVQGWKVEYYNERNETVTLQR